MVELYPLLMKPHFDPRPWGARDLAPMYDFHVHPGEEPIGEVWLTWDECEVANGPLAGRKLSDLCRLYGPELVGAKARETERYPLLIKFLFPRDKLSVQVHPDDVTAMGQGEPCGKTECWYVVDTDGTAQLALGLKNGASRESFEQAIRDQRAEELLNWLEVSPGDMIYVEAGTVHTLGPGLIILETQQNSDTTYRLYDYGRDRELHIDKGMNALKQSTGAGKMLPQALDAGHDLLIQNDCFTVERFNLSETRTFQGECGCSATNLVAIDGCGVVEAAGCEPVMFQRGEAVVIPAAVDTFTVRPQWRVELLKSNV